MQQRLIMIHQQIRMMTLALIISGCLDSEACNYNDLANTENGSCTYPELYYNCDDECLNDIDDDGVCDELELLGCTDYTSFNYNNLLQMMTVHVYL